VRTLPELFNAVDFFVDRHLAEGGGGRTAFRYRGRSVTYEDVATLTSRAASVLADLGIEIENRVLLALPDGPAFAAVFWGTARLGAVAVPVPTQLAPAEYEFILNDSRAKVAVVDSAIAPAVLAARARCPWLRAVLVADGPASGGAALEPLLDQAPSRVPAARTFREDPVYWGYTSGSTGRPKAAVHSHKDLVAAADLVGVGVFGLGPDDLVFSASKLFFAFGLGNSLYFPAAVGAAAVLVPERMDAERALATISDERPTAFFAVPTLYARMLEVPAAERRFDLSSLRFAVSSGEALPPPIFDAWRARFGLELVEVVGSTEALHDFIANRPGRVRRGSAGRVVPGFEVRLVDDEGAAVPVGSVGHLLVRGETTAPFYWNRLERTRATMLGEWLRTGDMFRQDAEGFFYFCGRSDDMLKVAGMWVSPAEVEAHLVAHPAVLEAGVIGRADAAGLIRPHAYVTLKTGHAASTALSAELGRFVRDRGAGYKAPAWIDFVEELPKTATGKVQRFRLRGPAGGPPDACSASSSAS
jgi:benzoate-CoA ligase